MRTVAGAFKSPVVLNKLEGDAAMFFAPINPGEESATIEKITKQAMFAYQEFKRTRDDLLSANICFCGACLGMQSLTLKTVLCLGPVVEKTLLGKTELSGDTIIVAHRLLKNSIQSHEYLLMNAECYQYAKPVLGDGVKTIDEQVDGYGTMPLSFLDGHALDQHIESMPRMKRSIFQGIGQMMRIQLFLFKRGIGAKKKQTFIHLPSQGVLNANDKRA
jgi:hypothetical protein